MRESLARSHPPSIVLTGGPGGGKTTLMRELHAADPAGRWLLLPEAAPLLFRAGLSAREKQLQKGVVRLQAALEEAYAEAAPAGSVLLCHRGTLDPLAYWLRNGWEEDEFFRLSGTGREEHFRRYTGVLHLQTAAIGAAAHYRRWPDAHRPETAEQAAEIDRLCMRAWGGHPRYCLLDNAGRDWVDKATAARTILERWLADPVREGG